MKQKNNALLTEGNVNKILMNLTLPMIVGIVGMSMFNLVDTWFVGQLGPKELAAMSFTFPVVLVIGSIAMGLGVGASSVIARAIGEGNHHRVQRLTTDSLLLSFIVVLVFVIAGLNTIEPLFLLLGASRELVVLISDYMLIWYLGIPLVIIPMVGNSAIRATGDTRTPTRVMLISMAVNIVLDPLLIFGYGPVPGLGLKGAAIATVAARFVTVVVAMNVLYKREKMITFEKVTLQEVFESWRQILYIGLPASGTNLIMPLSLGIITRLIAEYGNSAVAGFGVGSRVGMFATSVVAALGSVLAPFVGQNWGAGKLERVRYGIRSSHLFTVGWGLFVFVVFIFFSEELASLFNDDIEIVKIASSYMIIISASYGFQGILRLSGNAFNALNRPHPSAVLVVLQMFGLTVPLALIGSKLFGINGVFYAAALANFITGTISYLWINKVLKTDIDSEKIYLSAKMEF